MASQTPNLTLCQRTQEHDSITLARIYRLTHDVLQHSKYHYLYTPLQHVQDQIDRSHPLCLGNEDNNQYADVSHELTEFWVDMWTQHGLVPWNFHLFNQQDGRVAIVHFDNFGFHNWAGDQHWITMPCNVSLNYFFEDSWFPVNFYNTIRDIDGVSPVFQSIMPMV